MKTTFANGFLIILFCFHCCPKNLNQTSHDTSAQILFQACVTDTLFCGIASHSACVTWGQINYPDIGIFKNTTFCQSYKSYYWCARADYYSKIYWNYKYCDNRKCEKPKVGCQFNVSYEISSSSIQLNLSTLPFEFVLLISNIQKWYCTIFTHCNNCTNIAKQMEMQFKGCIMQTSNISDASLIDIRKLSQNTTYDIYILPVIEKEFLGVIKRFSVKTKISSPATPSNVRCFNRTSSEITFIWDLLEDINLDGKAKEFNLTLRDTNSSSSFTTNETFYQVRHLLPCQRYCVTITATNDGGRSKPSNYSCSYTKAIFSRIYSKSIQWNSTNSFTLVTWQYNNIHKCPIGFRIQWRTNENNTSFDDDSITINGNQIEIRNLSLNKKYMIRVRPEFHDDYGNFSDFEEIYTNSHTKETFISSDYTFVILAIIVLCSLLFTAVILFNRQFIVKSIRQIKRRNDQHDYLGQMETVHREPEEIECDFTVSMEKIDLAQNDRKVNKTKTNQVSPPNATSVTKRSVTFYQKDFSLVSEQTRLIKEFRDIQVLAKLYERETNLTTDIGAAPDNRFKNRFSDILPFDQTRLILNGSSSAGNYINANIIPYSYNINQIEYIACQGPQQQDMSDFWLMIWEQNVSLIVMLTRTSEDDKVKCCQYWPDEAGNLMEFEDDNCICVTMEKESINDVFLERNFLVSHKNTKEGRHLTHLQMNVWFDHSAPKLKDFGVFLFQYHNLVNQNKGSPVVIHCSAGVGRTGTLIVIDRVIRKLVEGHQTIDVFKEVLEIRKYRKFMVQNQGQYNFIHEFLQYFLMQYMNPEDNEEEVYINLL